jgi:hypothetical protein
MLSRLDVRRLSGEYVDRAPGEGGDSDNRLLEDGFVIDERLLQ